MTRRPTFVVPPNIPATIIDRSRPRYRLFDLSDEPDGRMLVWCVVGADNTPGAEVSPELATDLFAYIAAQPWKHLFYQAFRKNRKATLYEPLVLPAK
jgi:hypothetical protein